MKHTIKTIALSLLLTSGLGHAAVSPEEAEQLKSTLTPMGAEKAANNDGSIPAWTGGMHAGNTENADAQPRIDYFAGDKPIAKISVDNLDQYRDEMSEGMAALIEMYPDTFYLNVYDTKRTAAAPQWVYDNTYTNALNAITKDDGNSIDKAFGGIPFPIPKTGAEVMWNHLVRWRGVSVELGFSAFVGSSDGATTLAVAAKDDHQFPYYYPDKDLESFNGDAFLLRQEQVAPAFKAGESILIRDPLDQISQGRKAWQYLAGQRRVRRAPNIAFDTPDFVASGQSYFDEVFMFFGSLERFNWKIVGKKEVYVPYNNNGFLTQKLDDVLVPHHLNPEHLRWEKHRVWVVEANLAEGQRHVVPKKVFYVDEDSWSVLLVDGYDANGNLWRAQHSVPFVAPDIPAVVATTFIIYNLPAKTWLANNLYNEKAAQYKPVRTRPDIFFSPDALAGSSVR